MIDSEAGRITSMIFVLVAMAYGVNAVVTMLGVPSALASLALGLGKIGILLMVMGLMLFIGFLLEEISTMVVMVPIFWPSVSRRINAAFGIVICGAAIVITPDCFKYTPPSAASVLALVFRKVIPFLIGITILNVIVVFIPQLSTFLPRMFYK
jgi:TRAP-type C4-dicarboxylate transport system permease large subunit